MEETVKTGVRQNNKDILKTLFINAFIVTCLLELFHSASALTDTYFTGNFVGSLGMAAMSCARPFFSFIAIIGGPLGLGLQLTCSHAIGRGDMDRARKVFSGALTAGILISLLVGVWGYTHAGVIASMYGKEKGAAEVIPQAAAYLRGLFIGVPGMVAFSSLAPVVQIGGGKKFITWGIVAQLVGDVAGDALSVFAFDGGMYGLGLATAFSYYCAAIPLLFYFAGKDPILPLRLSWLTKTDLKEITRAGASNSIKRICNTVKPIILNWLSLLLGMSLALSAYSVTNQMRDLLISFSAGTTSATLLLGALLYARSDREGLKYVSGLAMKSIGFITALGALCVIFARPIAGIFISDSEEVLAMAATSVRCVGIMIPFTTFNGMIISFMQITKRYRLVNALSYMNRLILVVLCSAVFGFFFGTNGLWWALPGSEIINAIISLLVVRKLRGAFPRKTEDLFCFEKDFGFRPEDFIEVSIKSADDLNTLEEAVGSFCSAHGIDRRRSFFTQLALEELTMNVIKHGFPQCRKTPVIHVWIRYEAGDIKLRFQDNCPGFNVMKFCSELKEQSPEHCVGLRLVSGISKDMNYVNLLGTNELIITV